jgi:glycosyltransferase involved in cell wall biosynthesis
LGQCIKSVLSQKGVEVRALIIDDCSSDDTEVVGLNLAKGDRRVLYRRHRQNLGHIATYNEGLLEWAEADYVLLLSADDMLAPNSLMRAAHIFDENHDAGLCYGRQIVFEDQPPKKSTLTEEKQTCEVMSGKAFIEMCCSEGGNPVGTPTAVVRTSLQKRIGGYRPDLPHSGDLEMWLRCACEGHVARLDEIQAYKREHSTNMVKGFTATILPDLKQRLMAFESAIRICNGRIGDSDLLLEMARTSLAGQAFWGAHSLFEEGFASESKELSDFAIVLDPSWASRPDWKRLMFKRKLGARVWKLINPFVEYFRNQKFH